MMFPMQDAQAHSAHDIRLSMFLMRLQNNSKIQQSFSLWYIIYRGGSTTLPPAISNSFQSTSIPCSLNIVRALSAIDSKPSVARARMVGPAPDKQMPKSPGCVDGVIFDVTSGRPGICRATDSACHPTFVRQVLTNVFRYGWWTLSFMAS